MKTLTLALVLFSTLKGFALTSPFPSSVPGISIPNFHQVDNRQSVYRGMHPLKHLNEIKAFGFTDILIFKNDTRGEVAKEKAALLAMGYPAENIHHISFQWKDFVSYQQACNQTVHALRIMRYAHANPNRKLFFHCTVGEDRTGLLAGLWKQINYRWSAKSAFYYEMCQNGYERGNPNKPSFVVSKIRESLTPLYKVMSYMIASGRLSYQKLDYKVCNSLGSLNNERVQNYFLTNYLKCKASSKLTLK